VDRGKVCLTVTEETEIDETGIRHVRKKGRSWGLNEVPRSYSLVCGVHRVCKEGVGVLRVRSVNRGNDSRR